MLTSLLKCLLIFVFFAFKPLIATDITISGTVYLLDLNFNAFDGDLVLTADTLKTEYDYTVEQGWSGVISPVFTVCLEKAFWNPLVDFEVTPKLTTQAFSEQAFTPSHHLYITGKCNIHYPNNFYETDIVCKPDSGLQCSPVEYVYENEMHSLKDQDFFCCCTYPNYSRVNSPQKTDKSVAMFKLHQNYPNPFNSKTVIGFDVHKPSHVTIKVYDMLGKPVTTLTDAIYATGYHQLVWDTKNSDNGVPASGAFILFMQVDEYTSVRTMLLVN